MSSPNLRDAALLGSYSDRDEYQIGRTLVWVQFGSSKQRKAATDLACRQFSSVWASIPLVIAEACRFSREELPEFWQLHEAAGSVEDVLSVWGIWIEPVSGTATYEVSTNHDFSWQQESDLPDFPEEYYVMVERSREGVVRAQARQANAAPGT